MPDVSRLARGRSPRQGARRSRLLLRILACVICVALPSLPSLAASDQPLEPERGAAVPQPIPEPGVAADRAQLQPSRAVDTRPNYRAIIERETRLTGLPAEIAEAVMGVESAYNPDVVGADGEIGLMQVLPSTARTMGFTGSLSELARPEVNIRYGVGYLAQAWNRAGGDLCTAVMKYRAGHGETRFSHLSVDYCLRVRARLAARGYQVSGPVPIATFGPVAGSCRRRCIGTQGYGRINLAALNSRLSRIVLQVSAQRSALR